MSARAILVAKVNSFPFDDRVLLLDVPAKIGRSHKDDQAESGNGFFDCKVLSRQHAIIIYEEGKFYIVDTGSSNGTFVNNIRLSKSGEESKMTEIFTGDILRFGSDIVDKSRQVTQKCIVTKVRLCHCDGTDAGLRPSESRLFRPTDSYEDLSTMTLSLQEALAREKMLEDKLMMVKSMISKNIGKSHTDMLRIFEDIKEELMHLYQEREAIVAHNKDDGAVEKLGVENVTLKHRVTELEHDISNKDQTIGTMQRQQQSDGLELMTLRKACQMQKQDMEVMDKRIIQAEEQCKKIASEGQADKQQVIRDFETQLQQQEDAFDEERRNIKEKLHDVTSNEINLLNRIKSYEANEGYSRAEIDKVLAKEREATEMMHQLQYRVECLETELSDAHQVIEEQKSQVVVQRFPEDIEKITQQEATIENLHKEVAYIKQELIEARSHKSASDDELGTVKDQIETMQNNITSLSEECTRLRKHIANLEETVDVKTKDADHMRELVAKMESTPGQNEMNKVQIADLKTELAKTEDSLKSKADEMLHMKRDLRLKDETIQQREIEISCLRGQVQNIQDELSILKENSSEGGSLKDENKLMELKITGLQDDLEATIRENERLTGDLHRQETLYTELKKMRGRGEEMDMLQEMEQEARQAQRHILDLEHELGRHNVQMETVAEEKVRLLREIAQLKAGKQMTNNTSLIVDDQATNEGGYYYTSPSPAPVLSSNSPAVPTKPLSTQVMQRGKHAISSVGALRLYEFMLGLFFIAAMINWTFFS